VETKIEMIRNRHFSLHFHSEEWGRGKGNEAFNELTGLDSRILAIGIR